MAQEIVRVAGSWEKDVVRMAAQLSIWTNKLRRLEPMVQDQTAEIVAAIYRKKLRRGVGESLSPITKIIRGDTPPLSGLADHVVVKRARRGKPAVITYEKAWTKIAFLLDRGYLIQPTPAMKRMLFAQIAEQTGMPASQSLREASGGIWLVPGRPHLHLLTGPEMDAMLLKVARFVVKHGRLPSISSTRPESVPFTPDSNIDLETVAFKLGNEGEVVSGRSASGPDSGGSPTTPRTTRAGSVLRRRRS